MPASHPRSPNLLLRSLTPEDWDRLAPHLERHSAETAEVLTEAGEAIDTVYFPETVVTSIAERFGGEFAEVAVIGCEGMIGWPILLGARHTSHRVMVRLDGGTLLACPASVVRRQCRESDAFATRMFDYVQAIARQFSHSIVANLSSPVEARLARWLLMLHDRAPHDTLSVTHHELAAFLGVRRASVTDSLHVLEGERMLRCTRGRIDILDRAELEARAGAIYGAAEDAYRSLIGAFGKTGGARYPAAPRSEAAIPDRLSAIVTGFIAG